MKLKEGGGGGGGEVPSYGGLGRKRRSLVIERKRCVTPGETL